eukprot:TRINITY_DN20776_c0_g1_i2.p1 TRINITY_DN20776_c0_g1~~TRINITY_DN20776_c0_g1_i2.p1  ORF type:complete len:275 (+),score=31.12 TRINITY_DN20776_c0_g1_i2:112-825(+)
MVAKGEEEPANELGRPSTGAVSDTLVPPASEPSASPTADLSTQSEATGRDASESAPAAAEPESSGEAQAVERNSPVHTQDPQPQAEAPLASGTPSPADPRAETLPSASVDVVASRNKLPQLSPNTAVVSQPLSADPKETSAHGGGVRAGQTAAPRPPASNDLSRPVSDIDPTVLARRRRNRRRQFPKQQMAPLSFNQIQESYPSKESTVNSLGLRLPSLMQSLSKPTPRSMGTTTQW